MFEHPPAWTAPLANLTAWFDWQAIAAIGTMLAVWVALWQAGAAARITRRKLATSLFAYSILLEDLVIDLRDLEVDAERFGTQVVMRALRLSNLDKLKSELELFSLHDFPTPMLWWQHVQARNIVSDLARTLDQLRFVNIDRAQVVATARTEIDQLAEIARLFALHSQSLYGRFFARIRAAQDLKRHEAMMQADLSHVPPPRTAGPTDETDAPSSPAGSA